MAHEKTTFFMIDRKLLGSSIWLNEPFTRGQAWVDLIGLANYGDVKKYDGDTVQTFERGTVVTGERALAARWQWSKTKVRSFLAVLESDKMIVQKKTAKGTLISIENYAFYQSRYAPQKPEKDRTKTAQKPEKDRSKTENKKSKEDYKNTQEEREGAKPRGPYSHLTLTEGELAQFLTEYPADGERFITEMDEYMDAEGKSYKNCYTALKRWARNDSKFAGKKQGGSGWGKAFDEWEG